MDYCKRLNAARRGASRDEQLNDFEPAAVEHVSGIIERKILIDQVDSILNKIAPGEAGRRHRVIFWLFYRQGYSSGAIASLPWVNLTEKGVESTVRRLASRVREEIGESCLAAITEIPAGKAFHKKTSL